MSTVRCAVLTVLAGLLSACSAGSSLPGTANGAGAPAPGNPGLPSGSKIQHVIILVQENRTFDNLFHGFPGADYAKTGVDFISVGALTHSAPAVDLSMRITADLL